ncbi:hypothetical protein GGE24_003306 [Bradyrhizobium centrosematis]|nr:hypothetical protein [Bradyrhizobium centrosematis]
MIVARELNVWFKWGKTIKGLAIMRRLPSIP